MDGSLYQEYCSVFGEWYGEPISEDALSESGYPQNDFREWLKTRVMDFSDETAEREPEISEGHLDEEIERIRNLIKDSIWIRSIHTLSLTQLN